MKLQLQVKGIADFQDFVCKEILPKVKPQTLFLLEGEVGAGKTELVKALCDFLKLKDVQSPTFAFHQAYESGETRLHHVDLYRVKNEEDLESIGFWDLFEDESSCILVEWSNLIQDEAWPWNWKPVRIKIRKVPSNPSAREIDLEFE